MATHQDGHQIWHILGIGNIIIGVGVLPQLSTEFGILAVACIVIGLIGGLKSIFTTVYDFAHGIFRRFPPVERQLALITIGVALPPIGWLETKLSALRTNIQRRDLVATRIDEFVDSARTTGMYVPKISGEDRSAITTAIVEEGSGPVTKTAVYPEIAKLVYREESPPEIETRLVVLYTYEMDQTDSNNEKSKFLPEIDSLLTGISFHPLDDNGQRVLTTYHALRVEGWQEPERGALFDHDVHISEIDIEGFVKQYTRQQFSTYLMKTKEQAEEFRQTLADLVRHGRVQLQNLTEDVIEEKLANVKQQLEDREDRYSSYILLSTKLMNSTDEFGAVEALEKKYPQTVRILRKSVAGSGFPALKYVSMRIVYTDETFESAADFLELEVKPHLPSPDSDEWPAGGFVAAIPFEAPHVEIYPLEDAVLASEDEAKRDYRRDNIDAVKMLTVAREAVAANIVTDDVQREEDVDTLLRVIPFNVVAPDLDASVKDFIKYNYSEIKPHFPQVESLFHWPEVNEAKLISVLQELDDEDEPVCDDWEAVVTEIMDEIEEIAAASHISVYTKSSEQATMA